MKDWRGHINDAETWTLEADKLSPWKLQAKNLWRLVERPDQLKKEPRVKTVDGEYEVPQIMRVGL